MPPSPDVFISKCVCKYGGQNLTDPKAILKNIKNFPLQLFNFNTIIQGIINSKEACHHAEHKNDCRNFHDRHL